jgi:hypothetical protein
MTTNNMKTNYFLLILEYIGALTLYVIIISVGIHLIETKIVSFKFDWILYFYYAGLGILSWFPCYNYIIGFHKRQK